MTREPGVLLKFFGPWRDAAGVDEKFVPSAVSLPLESLAGELLRKAGGTAVPPGEGLVCLFDERSGPRALKDGELIPPGSTLLFLGIVESG
ncbi:MAG: hypothetical protein FNP40_08040 [Dehalobacter sp. 4CP]|nr:hypothetical protein [Dehalobacter sp. 4CP]